MLQDGEAASYWAAYMGHTNILKILIEYGAAEFGSSEVTTITNYG